MGGATGPVNGSLALQVSPNLTKVLTIYVYPIL